MLRGLGLRAPDPDNWSENYQVAFWKSEWKNLWLESNGIIAKIANYGIDGIYLDWVGAADGVDVVSEMITFIEELRAAGRVIKEPLKNSLLPLVSRVSLDPVTTTPPPKYEPSSR